MKLPPRDTHTNVYIRYIVWTRSDFAILIQRISHISIVHDEIPPKKKEELKKYIYLIFDNLMRRFDVLEEACEERNSLLRALDIYSWEQFVVLAQVIAEPYINLEG